MTPTNGKEIVPSPVTRSSEISDFIHPGHGDLNDIAWTKRIVAAEDFLLCVAPTAEAKRSRSLFSFPCAADAPCVISTLVAPPVLSTGGESTAETPIDIDKEEETTANHQCLFTYLRNYIDD